MIGVGIHDIDDAAYHADPCPEPSLSSSIAVKLVQQSASHAWHAHPRLNPDFEDREASKALDKGSAAHELILRGEVRRLKVIDADDFKTKLAKGARDDAYEAGLIPVLIGDYRDALAMCRAVRAQLSGHADAPDAFTAGKPEQTLIWQEDGLWFRSKVDWLSRWFDDLKTTGGSAEPGAWIRNHLFPMGYDMQAAFYLRGARALGLNVRGFRFIVVENKPPYALSVVAASPATLALAERKVSYAITKWRECLRSGEWPGYAPRVAHADLPTWEETRWLERELREEESAA